MSPLKPATDVSGNTVLHMPVAAPLVISAVYSGSIEKNMNTFFEAESAATLLTKPWLRLERGLRLQKFRLFAEAYPGLSDDEKTNMLNFLVKANDSKQLNTKAQIHYENGVIQSIKGLKIIRTGDPTVPAVFKIETGRQTKRNTSTEDD